VKQVVGKARALKRGHYPTPSGAVRIIPEGAVFDLVEGLTKARWFVQLDEPKPVEVTKVEDTPRPKGRQKAGATLPPDDAGDIA
jgi:hypothetical protein